MVERDASIQAMEEIIGDIGLKISWKIDAVALSKGSSTKGGSRHSTTKSGVYFERRKFPSFHGQKRDFFSMYAYYYPGNACITLSPMY